VLRSNEITLGSHGLLDTQLDLTFSLQVSHSLLCVSYFDHKITLIILHPFYIIVKDCHLTKFNCRRLVANDIKIALRPFCVCSIIIRYT